jgi:hypothetical protein
MPIPPYPISSAQSAEIELPGSRFRARPLGESAAGDFLANSLMRGREPQNRRPLCDASGQIGGHAEPRRRGGAEENTNNIVIPAEAKRRAGTQLARVRARKESFRRADPLRSRDSAASARRLGSRLRGNDNEFVAAFRVSAPLREPFCRLIRKAEHQLHDARLRGAT